MLIVPELVIRPVLPPSARMPVVLPPPSPKLTVPLLVTLLLESMVTAAPEVLAEGLTEPVMVMSPSTDVFTGVVVLLEIVVGPAAIATWDVSAANAQRLHGGGEPQSLHRPTPSSLSGAPRRRGCQRRTWRLDVDCADTFRP